MTKAISFPKQGEVWWVNLDPTVGKEIKKRRPCVVVSPNEMNRHLGTVIVVPLTSTFRNWPTRVQIELSGELVSIALDQIRMVDNTRLVKKMDQTNASPMLAVLREMFA
jgi:mRNA interferase MazF